MTALIHPCDVAVGAQLRQRRSGVEGGVADRGRERRVLVRYISTMEMALGIMSMPNTYASYRFTDVFVGLPDTRRRYIDANGAVRHASSEGGIFYRAYLARSENSAGETFVEWCKKYDSRGWALKENALQRVQLPCVSKEWHVERVAWYAILKHFPHYSRPYLDVDGSFVGLAAGLGIALDGDQASSVDEFVDMLEQWWKRLYQIWLATIGQKHGWRTERTFEVAAQAFNVWRDKHLSSSNEASEGGKNESESTGRRMQPLHALRPPDCSCEHTGLPSSRHEFEELGFVFNENNCIVSLPREVLGIVTDLSTGGKNCDEQLAFVVAVLSGIARGKQLQYFLTGRAGTGKSFLFAVLRRVLQVMGGNVLVLAPTALLAREATGHTIQSASGIGWGIRRRLSQEMTVLQARCDVVMIEEVGMVSCDDAEGCETAIREARTSGECARHPQRNALWGGCHVICCGDFGQMKPPGARALPFWTSRLWNAFESCTFTLEVVQRAEEESLVEVLDIVRDFTGFEDCRIGRLRELLLLCRTDSSQSMRLCATHATAQVYNEERANALRRSGISYARSIAEDRLVSCNQTNIKDIGLEEDVIRDVKRTLSRNHAAVEALDIFVGEKYTLTSNSHYHEHIRNGTVVTVEGVELRANGSPKCVYASSPSWKGVKVVSPSVIPDHGSKSRRAYIQVCEEIQIRRGVKRSRYRVWNPGSVGRYVRAVVARKQFAMLMYSGGGTVHRFQGATLVEAAIECSDDICLYCDGMIYVALSRVRRLENVAIRNVEDVIARIRSCSLAARACRRGNEKSASFRELCEKSLRTMLEGMGREM